jgi:hypothetical protein
MSTSKKENQNNPAPVPVLGSEVDQKYLQSFYPKPEKDMKWVYSMIINVQGINVQAELIMEITEIKGKNVTIKTIMGTQCFENVTSLDAFAPVPNGPGANKNLSGFIFENLEDLIVPMDEFKNAAKLSTKSNQGKAYLWLVSGIGPVKFGINTGGIPASLELKEFIH